MPESSGQSEIEDSHFRLLVRLKDKVQAILHFWKSISSVVIVQSFFVILNYCKNRVRNISLWENVIYEKL